MQGEPNFFSGPFIDRRAEVREAPHRLADARADPGARFLVAAAGLHLVFPGAEAARIAFLRADDPLVRAAADAELVLLGWFEGGWCWLVDLPDAPTAGLPPGSRFEELRPLSAQLSAAEAALLAYARGLSLWRARHRFCGTCGAPTLPERAGHVLRCTSPSAHHIFPRIDPAIIVLVSDGERALLGRQPGWPPRRYSTIAGFVEPGESLEDAVAREVMEECGVPIAGIRYHSSQPWPFPSSLMIGFHAAAPGGVPIRLGGELEDARWVSRADISSGGILPPPPHTIAHRLIAGWFDAGGIPLSQVLRGRS